MKDIQNFPILLCWVLYNNVKSNRQNWNLLIESGIRFYHQTVKLYWYHWKMIKKSDCIEVPTCKVVLLGLIQASKKANFQLVFLTNSKEEFSPSKKSTYSEVSSPILILWKLWQNFIVIGGQFGHFPNTNNNNNERVFVYQTVHYNFHTQWSTLINQFS